jgi:hypothetical protein
MDIKTIGLIGGFVLAGSLIVTPRAKASTLPDTTVLYSESPMVQGSANTLTTLSVPGAGELFLTLTDLDFPSPFSSLKFSLTDTAGALVGFADPGTLTLDLTKPTTLYADVVATTQAGTEAGLYNLTATFLGASPVPLPASGLLLGGGIALALIIKRRHKVAKPGCALLGSA